MREGTGGEIHLTVGWVDTLWEGRGDILES